MAQSKNYVAYVRYTEPDGSYLYDSDALGSFITTFSVEQAYQVFKDAGITVGYELLAIERGDFPASRDSDIIREYVDLMYLHEIPFPDFWLPQNFSVPRGFSFGRRNGYKNNEAVISNSNVGPKKPTPAVPLEVFQDKERLKNVDYMAAVRDMCKGMR